MHTPYDRTFRFNNTGEIIDHVLMSVYTILNSKGIKYNIRIQDHNHNLARSEENYVICDMIFHDCIFYKFIITDSMNYFDNSPNYNLVMGVSNKVRSNNNVVFCPSKKHGNEIHIVEEDYFAFVNTLVTEISNTHDSFKGGVINAKWLDSYTLLGCKMQQPRSKYFISFKSTDTGKDIAKIIKDRLMMSGATSVFFSEEDIPVGADMNSTILNNLHDAETFISIHSKGYNDSNYCNQEIGKVSERDNIKMVSILVDENPTAFFNNVQGIKWSDGIDSVINQILEYIKRND